MTNARIRIVLFILNFTDVVSNVQVVDQRPSADEKILIPEGSFFQYFGNSGESLDLSGITVSRSAFCFCLLRIVTIFPLAWMCSLWLVLLLDVGVAISLRPLVKKLSSKMCVAASAPVHLK